MLTINTETFEIDITRGDSASIEFSAKQKNKKTYIPAVTDVLKFAVSKKWGGTPLMEINNPPLGTTPTNYIEASPTSAQYNIEPEYYYTESGGVYTQCTSAMPFNPSTQYYILDYSEFWTIEITRNKWLDDAGNDKFKFQDYVWDCQVTTTTGDITIIGQWKDEDGEIHDPIFKVLGESAEE